MSLHIKLTMMILFTNICLTVLVPGLAMSNSFYSEDSVGNYNLNGNLTDSLGTIDPATGGIVPNSFGLIDVFLLLSAAISILINIFLGAFIILFYLPGEWALILGIPIIIAYFLAILGWLKGNN